MISDSQLNSLAIFLGTLMMALIVFYHFLAVNATDSSDSKSTKADITASKLKPAIVAAK